MLAVGQLNKKNQQAYAKDAPNQYAGLHRAVADVQDQNAGNDDRNQHVGAEKEEQTRDGFDVDAELTLNEDA